MLAVLEDKGSENEGIVAAPIRSTRGSTLNGKLPASRSAGCSSGAASVDEPRCDTERLGYLSDRRANGERDRLSSASERASGCESLSLRWDRQFCDECPHGRSHGRRKAVLFSQMRIDAERAGVQKIRIVAPEKRFIPAILAPQLRLVLLWLSPVDAAKKPRYRRP